jgi:hypothetical protein
MGASPYYKLVDKVLNFFHGGAFILLVMFSAKSVDSKTGGCVLCTAGEIFFSSPPAQS